MSDMWGKVRALAGGDHARGCQGRNYTCECGHDDAVQGTLSFAKVEITRLRAELEQARDKALDEATGLMDLKDAGWRALETKYRAAGNNGPYLGSPSYDQAAQAIRALKSTKPIL